MTRQTCQAFPAETSFGTLRLVYSCHASGNHALTINIRRSSLTMRILAFGAIVLALCAPAANAEINVSEAEKDYMEALYLHFHRNPELSLYEFETASRMAEEFAAAGYEVTAEVGGTGVVGVLRNGEGPTVMIRGDMDALRSRS